MKPEIFPEVALFSASRSWSLGRRGKADEGGFSLVKPRYFVGVGLFFGGDLKKHDITWEIESNVYVFFWQMRISLRICLFVFK